MPLLSNVIFLSESGSGGRGFGDISLNQGTDSQSIATATHGCYRCGPGRRLRHGGFHRKDFDRRYQRSHPNGSGQSDASPATVASVGGLFFMAGDNNGPADGGSAGKNTDVEIESLTIELNLSAVGTFGANNTVGGLFTVSSGVSAAMGGSM